ncbi:MULTISPECIES: nucleotidyltransferase family protein [Shewanella]|uniref:Nucleotidyltransferase family protein n=1 Tax=Shewanella indica TaxID=768528 RepID=A0ABU4QDC3_9GAMM|nr:MULTISPECIES: nucleotidyltransferase family protein [Shewanella]MDX6017427.1 nucleotidyltransferase family protein [Shewanella indica]
MIYDEFEPRGSLQVSETEATELIENWLRQDRMRMQALECVANLGPIDAWLAAGFVRNLVWDKLHGTVSRLSDIDVIYFEPSDHSEVTDRAYEAKLVAALDLPWSVKNQARMHLKNNHQPYVSVSDAMSYWPEQQTALAVRLRAGELQLLNLFPLGPLLALELSPNPKSTPGVFESRLKAKNWLADYPLLKTPLLKTPLLKTPLLETLF